MFAVRYNPAEHEVADIPFAAYLRSHFQDPLLFTFRHRRTGNWVAAAWVKEKWGKLLELVILGPAPMGSREAVRRIEAMVRGSPGCEATKKQNLQDIRLMHKRAERYDLEVDAQGDDAMRFLKHRAEDHYSPVKAGSRGRVGVA